MLVAVVVCAALSSRAQFVATNQSSPNRISLSYRPGFNITARFNGLGGFPAQTEPGPALAGANHRYDDGFNLLDSSDNSGGLTWNWGYAHASQLAGNDSVVMHSSSAAAAGVATDANCDPQHGLEMSFNRQLGALGKCPWGVELAFNYMDLDIVDSQTVSTPVTRLADAYSLGGIVPPLAPYVGSFSGPGAMISDSPMRSLSTVPGGAMILGRRTLEGSLYGGRLGPYLEIPLDQWFRFSLSGGLAVLWVDSDFGFTETVTIPGVGSVVAHSGYGSDSDWLVGGYVGGTLSLAMSQKTRVFAGAQFQDVGTFSQIAGGRKAELDLGKSIFVTLGVSYEF